MFENKKLIQLVTSGVLALLFVQFYLKAKDENREMGLALVDVLVASRDISPQKAITADLITTKKIAQLFIEPGAYREKLPGEARKRVVGKVTMSAIPAGAQILQTNLRNPSATETGLAPMLPPGKRGYVMRLGNLDIAKLILPGDRIDILATFTVRQKGSDATSKVTYTILQNIQVVAVDKDIIKTGQDVRGKSDSTEGRLLTLAVDPVEAEKMAHAQIESGGEISVVVRAQGDEQIRPITPINSTNLLTNPSQPPSHPPTEN